MGPDMCLIAFAWQRHPRWPLLVAANRDEFHARPTRSATWWRHPRGLFAGLDERAGGSWCGVDRRGRFAAVTNVRGSTPAAADARSRGLIVRGYFEQTAGAAVWARHIHAEGAAFGPFNLLVGDRDALWFVSNRGPVRHRPLRPGIHAISNGHWGDHWPKTERAQARLGECVAADDVEPPTLFELLADTDGAPDAALPDTGIGTERERFLSPLFIAGAAYGTRASTVIRRCADDRIEFHERSFDATGTVTDRVDEHWAMTRETPT